MVSVVTVGTFDGVHVGHAALIRRARQVAEEIGASVVVAMFEPHPSAVLAPERCPARLGTFAQRVERCMAMLRPRVDRVVRLVPGRDLLDMSAEAFCAWLKREHGIRAIVEGSDFRFGRRREGDLATLRRIGAAMGFRVHEVEGVEVDLSDQLVVRASSSMARRLIALGRVFDAWRVLGSPHQLIGEVVRGDRRGRTIGFPTANLRCEVLAPADGVYAGRAILDDGREFDAAISVGTNPQFSGVGRRVEAHLIGVETDADAIAGVGEYGWTLRLDLLAWVRPQATYPSVDALVAQIGRDVSRTPGLIADAARAMESMGDPHVSERDARTDANQGAMRA